MKLIKYLVITIVILLSSCSKAVLVGEKKSAEATKEKQEEVKVQVMKLLEEEYKQPFKLESFDYKYENHFYGGDLTSSEYGTYYFKVQAVDNPIIVMDFNFNDGLATKESIKKRVLYFS